MGGTATRGRSAVGEAGGIARRELAIGAALFLLAAALRVGYVWSVADDPSVRYPALDSAVYHERAVEILSGRWLPQRVAFQAPLYPYFLALLYGVFGVGSKAVLAAQALLDSATVLLVYGMARRLFGEACAVLAGATAALYEVFFFFDALLLKVPLSVFLITLALYLLVRADLSGRPRVWFAGGAALGLACLTRGNYLAFVPVAGLFALISSAPPKLAKAGAYAAGVLAVVLPVSSVNYAVGGDFVLVTSEAGQNFYAGNHRGNATGLYVPPPFVRANPVHEEADWAAEAERRAGRPMKPSERSSFWFDQGVAEIRADPAHFARHLWTKARIYFGHHEVGDNQSYDYFEAHVSRLLRLPFPTYAAILPLALCGMVAGGRRRAAWLPIAFFVTYSASVLVFFNLARYRIPIVPVLAVFTGLALVRARSWARERRALPLAAAGVFLAVAYPFVYTDVIEGSFAMTYRNLGVRHLGIAEQHRKRFVDLEAAGDRAGAEAAREEALASMELAQRDLRRFLELQPDDRALRRALARLMVRIALERDARGDAAGALEQARRATSVFPRSADAWFQRGRLEALRGDPLVARETLERALGLAPGHPLATRELERLRAAAE